MRKTSSMTGESSGMSVGMAGEFVPNGYHLARCTQRLAHLKVLH